MSKVREIAYSKSGFPKRPRAMCLLRRLYSTARFFAAVDCVKAADPPNGPASAEFCMRTTHTLVAPPAVPWHVMPAGICTLTGKSMVEAADRPPMPMPGTFWVTCAVLKAAGSVPPEVASIMAVKGPAPSWLTWWNVMVIYRKR
jgi:hypothetical protein